VIRHATPADQAAILELAAASGLFEPSQTDELARMLSDHHQAGAETRDL